MYYKYSENTHTKIMQGCSTTGSSYTFSCKLIPVWQVGSGDINLAIRIFKITVYRLSHQRRLIYLTLSCVLSTELSTKFRIQELYYIMIQESKKGRSQVQFARLAIRKKKAILKKLENWGSSKQVILIQKEQSLPTFCILIHPEFSINQLPHNMK